MLTSPRTTRPTTAAGDEAAYHALPIERVLAALDAAPSGLATPEAERRLGRHGANRLPRARGPGPLALLARQLRTPLIYVLLGSAAAVAATIVPVAIAARGWARRREGRAS